MAGSINKIILVGHIGKTPEIRNLPNGAKVAFFSVATNEGWKDKHTGERKERTEWHRIVIFNEILVEVVEKHLNKGSKIYVEGSLRTRKWTDSRNIDHYATEIVLSSFRGELIVLADKGVPFEENDISPLPPPIDEIPF